MRGTLGRRLAGTHGAVFNQTLTPYSGFSTFSGGSSGGGGGRGRGRGSSAVPPVTAFADQTPGKPIDEDPNLPSHGIGHGKGKPISQTPPIVPAFSSFVSGGNQSVGRGRITQEKPSFSQQESQFGVIGSVSNANPVVNPSAGRGRSMEESPISRDGATHESQSGVPKRPIFFRKDDGLEETHKPQFSSSDLDGNVEKRGVPFNVSPGLPGAGRGKSGKFDDVNERGSQESRQSLAGAGRGKSGRFDDVKERSSQENRHLRPRADARKGKAVTRDPGSPRPPKMSLEDAIKNAMGVLNKDAGKDGGAMQEGGRGRGGFRGRGKGRGRGRGRGQMSGRGRGRLDDEEDEDDLDALMNLGEDADGEKLANTLGPEKMDQLNEAFDEMSYRVLPSPADDAYMDALHTNNMIEYEPEYLMGDFDRNPDIDDTPPIPLRDALEKMKPFLMVYEGIKSQEEWEEIIEDLMKRVPHMKKLIDHYSGPARVTAKQQQQELERVAQTIPDSAPASVKRFTSRAVLSLQSNPGWGWDKKCQFMDKLSWEINQQYK